MARTEIDYQCYRYQGLLRSKTRLGQLPEQQINKNPSDDAVGALDI